MNFPMSIPLAMLMYLVSTWFLYMWRREFRLREERKAEQRRSQEEADQLLAGIGFTLLNIEEDDEGKRKIFSHDEVREIVRSYNQTIGKEHPVTGYSELTQEQKDELFSYFRQLAAARTYLGYIQEVFDWTLRGCGLSAENTFIFDFVKYMDEKEQ